ncbi:Protein ECT2 [Echinococcus granulosus]|uniref:Protein ECT2 n=1 Tax=Echinococcus granulosus TaxID=6210 RepID=W6VB57_ECHGR|nr:Protein ECT2 [Echinococcus granulosus]EUB63999.1 Protein ECT2 [Echinococcus granulosus]
MRFYNRRWVKLRPVFSFAMIGAVVAITGFRDPAVVNQIASLVNWMGGSMRRKLDQNVTHLVAFRCAGEKVRKAALTSVNVATMKVSWVEDAWNLRHSNPEVNACDPDFVNQHRGKVFQECCLFFIGFSQNSETLAELEAIAKEHDGTLAKDLSDERLTHVVVADDWHKRSDIVDMSALLVGPNTTTKVSSPSPSSCLTELDLHARLTEVAFRVPVLRLDWFWKSLQSTYICHPQDFLYIHNARATDSPYASFLSSQRASVDPFSPQVAHRPSTETLGKENRSPHQDASECELAFQSCISPTNIEQSMLQRNDENADHHISREEVIAQLADPLLILSSNCRHSRGANSFILPETPSPPSSSTHNCSTLSMELHGKLQSNEDIEEKSKSPNSRTPLEAIKTSFEHSPHRYRASPNAADKRTPLQSRLKDRQHRVFEFLLTERNYLNILEYLTQTAFSEVLAEDQVGGPILPRAEADIVFGKLTPIYQLHKRLQSRLAELEGTWNMETSQLGEIVLPYIDEMEKVYSHYMQFYSAPHLQQLGREYPRFLAFMRQVERRKESGRQSLSDLLVRPVQRLPSMLLLIQGIIKFTPTSHPDYDDMSAFASKLSGILEHINMRLKKNEEHISLLNLYHDISGAPPEMLSSSRSLVRQLNVFQLDINASGAPTCEPVILFLLTDCLEIARPKKRNTGDNHAIQAALEAVESGSHSSLATGIYDEAVGGGEDASVAGNSSIGGSRRSTSISRAGSGASGVTKFGRGPDGKKRHKFAHLLLLKLQDIKRVLDLNTMSPERAAFSLIVRGASEEHDQMFTFCLAASFTATAAIASGKCPEAVESAVAAVTAGRRPSSFKDVRSEVAAGDNAEGTKETEGISSIAEVQVEEVDEEGGIEEGSAVAKLQHCVHEAKTSFLRRLCRNIMQVSFVASSPEDLLVEMQPEVVLAFDLDTVFSSVGNGSFKSKKFSRHLGRAISMKTPRRPANTRNANGPSTMSYHYECNSATRQGGRRVPSHVSGPPLGALESASSMALSSSISLLSTAAATAEKENRHHYNNVSSGFATPSRPSVLGSIFTGVGSWTCLYPYFHSLPLVLASPKCESEVSELLLHTTKATPMKSPTRVVNKFDETMEAESQLLNESYVSQDASITPTVANTAVVANSVTVSASKAEQKNLWLELISDEEGEEGTSGGRKNLCDGGNEEDDVVSVDSSSSSGPWPGFFPPPVPSTVTNKKTKKDLTAATSSTTSLRSNCSCSARDGSHARQSFGGLMNATRKSIYHSFLAGIRRSKLPERKHQHQRQQCQRNQQHTAPNSGSLSRVAPLATADEDECNEEDVVVKDVSGGGKASWLMRHQPPPRFRSVDLRTPGTASLDKSASECNLSLRVNRPISRVPATSSSTSIKNLFTSPFRVPTAPPLRKSIAAATQLVGKSKITQRNPSPESITSWSSLITLGEGRGEDAADVEVVMRRRPADSSLDTCSMIVHPSPSLLASSSSYFKKLKVGKKSKFRRPCGSAIFHRTRSEMVVKEEEQERESAVTIEESSSGQSSSNAGSSSRRESFFQRAFFFK